MEGSFGGLTPPCPFPISTMQTAASIGRRFVIGGRRLPIQATRNAVQAARQAGSQLETEP